MRTGARLHEDIAALNTAYDYGLDVEFADAPSREAFLATLESLRQRAQSGSYPILHVECHGSEDTKGLVLGDDSFISWQTLAPILTDINIASRCNLLVVLASCYGGHLAEIIQPTDRAPFWAMLGPKRVIATGELLSSFSAFYSEFFSSLDGEKALAALMGTDPRASAYFFTTAPAFFKAVYAGYLREYFSPEVLRQRGRRMARRLRNTPGVRRPGPAAVMRMLRRTRRSSFDQHACHFFMLDLFPENEARFRVSFEEVAKPA